MKFKIITGFRDDQFYTIDESEIHKAYYLFMNPESRTIFSDGVAIIGKNIQGIEPDYHSTMGWNKTHRLDTDDFNEMREKGILQKFTGIMSKGKEVAELAIQNQNLLKQQLQHIDTPESIANPIVKALASKMTNF